MTRVSACPSMSELSLDITLWSTTTTECSGATGKRLPSSSNPDDATAIFGEKSRVVSVLEVGAMVVHFPLSARATLINRRCL